MGHKLRGETLHSHTCNSFTSTQATSFGVQLANERHPSQTEITSFQGMNVFAVRFMECCFSVPLKKRGKVYGPGFAGSDPLVLLKEVYLWMLLYELLSKVPK